MGSKGQQGHLPGVHQEQPEHLPHAPGQGAAQDGPGGAGAQGDHRQLFPQLPPAAGGREAPRARNTPVSRDFCRKNSPGGVGGEHGAADDRQDKDHHHLLAGVTPLRQDRQDGGGAHHAGVGGDQQHGEKAAPGQKGVLTPYFSAAGRRTLEKRWSWSSLLPHVPDG